MLVPTDVFKARVFEVWGSPSAVLDAGENEMFRHGESVGLDHDDQVSHTGKIGLLAGELSVTGTAEEFIERFEREILNDGVE